MLERQAGRDGLAELVDARDALADAERPATQPPARAVRRVELLQQAGVRLLEQPRHCRQEVRPGVDEVLADALEPRAEADRHVAGHRHVGHEAGEGVGERQVDEAAVAAPHDAGHVARDARHRGVVALQEPAAPRLARGARRVDERHQVVGLHRRPRLVDGGRVRRRVRDAHRGDAVEPHLVAQGQGLRHHGDDLDRRRLVAHRRHAVGLHSVAGHHQAHRAVAQHVGEVLVGRRRVRRHRHHAGRQRRDVEQRPLQARLRDDAQAVAGPEAERQESVCELAHPCLDLGPRPVSPDTALACTVSDARVLRERMQIQSRDGFGRKRHGVRLGRSERVQALSAIGSSASCRTASNRVLSILPW